MKIDPKAPAFPVPAWTGEFGMNEPYHGINTRTWLAGLVIQGSMMHVSGSRPLLATIVKEAVEVTDALIAKLNKGNGE